MGKPRKDKVGETMSAVEKEFQRSNSTTAAFLGRSGKLKTWMVGGKAATSFTQPHHSQAYSHAPVKPSDSSSANHKEPSSTSPYRAPVASMVPEGETRFSISSPPHHEDALHILRNEVFSPLDDNTAMEITHEQPDHPQAEDNHSNSSSIPQRSKSPPPATMTTITNGQAKPSKSAANRDVSSSPEIMLASGRLVEKGNETSNPTNIISASATRQSPIVQSKDTAVNTRLEQLMARYGSFDELEKQLRMADTMRPHHGPSPGVNLDRPSQSSESGSRQATKTPTTSTSLSPNTPQQSLANSSSNDVNIHKRPRNESHESRKRPQLTNHASTHDRQQAWLSLSDAFVKHWEKPEESSDYRKLLQKYASTLAKRRNSMFGAQGRGQVEAPRLDLLLKACARSDHVYLLLHQMYCRDAELGPSNTLFGPTFKKGLQALQHPLASNDGMPADALQWFAAFPGPLLTVNSKEAVNPTAKMWFESAMNTLFALGKNWEELRDVCLRRKFPPLVGEMLFSLRVNSIVMQHVIFTTVLRQLIPERDGCFAMHEEVFHQNQQAYMASGHLLQVASTDPDKEFIHRHHAIRNAHTMHVLTLSQTPSDTTTRGNEAEQRIDSEARPEMQSPFYNTFSQAMSNSLGLSQPPTGQPASDHGPGLPQRPYPQSFNSANDALRSYWGQPFSGPNGQLFSGSNGQPASNVGWGNPPQIGGRGAGSLPIGLPNAPHTGILRSNAPSSNHGSFVGAAPPQIGSAGRRSVPNSSTGGPVSHDANQSPLPSPGIGPSRAQSIPFNYMQGRMSNIPQSTINPIRQASWPHTQPDNVSLQASVNSRVPFSHFSNMMPVTPMPQEDKYFQYVREIHTAPAVSQGTPFVRCPILLPPEEIAFLAKDRYNDQGVVVARIAPPGSVVYRVRCLKLGIDADFSDPDWFVSDHYWPDCITILLNEQNVEIRKKERYGKDIPADVTNLVKESWNHLTVALANERQRVRYIVGLETVEVTTITKIKVGISTIDEMAARQRVLSRIAVRDPDIEVIDPQITLDLTDPFTATIFEIPARGKLCSHDQCFDLDIFLNTRGIKNKTSNEPCSPDEFRCPICKSDVRPGNIVIDGFYTSIRTKLQGMNRLDAKAVTLGLDGDWTIKEEEAGTGESGDKCTKRSRERTQGASVPRSGASSPKTIIELDDD